MGLKCKRPVVRPGVQASLLGEVAARDGSVNLPPCKSCGATTGVIVPGSGPHHSGVRCLCGRFVRWLPRSQGEP
jgi:hypothetical protein